MQDVDEDPLQSYISHDTASVLCHHQLVVIPAKQQMCEWSLVKIYEVKHSSQFLNRAFLGVLVYSVFFCKICSGGSVEDHDPHADACLPSET